MAGLTEATVIGGGIVGCVRACPLALEDIPVRSVERQHARMHGRQHPFTPRIMAEQVLQSPLAR